MATPASRGTKRPKGICGKVVKAREAKAKREAEAIKNEDNDAKLSEDAIEEISDSVMVDSQDAMPIENETMSCVKMKLRTLCPHESICRLMDNIVQDVNNWVAQAYAFGNFHLTRLLVAGKPSPSIDAKFYDRCLIAVAIINSNKGTLNDDFKESIVAFDELRDEDSPKVNAMLLGDIKSELCIAMGTTAINHLWMNLAPRLKRYLAWTEPRLKSLHRVIVQCVALNPTTSLDKYPSLSLTQGNLSPARLRDVQEARRIICELREFSPITRHGSKSNAHQVIPLYFRMMMEIEGTAERQRNFVEVDSTFRRARRFTMLPMKNGFTVSNIPICSRALIGILRRIKDSYGKPIVPYTANQTVDIKDMDKEWRKYFNINAIETRNRHFGGRISTDGVSVTVYMSQTNANVLPSGETPFDSKSIEGCEDVDYCGIDPGTTDIVTMLHRNTGKIQSYSSSRYYQQSKVKLSMRKTEQWNKDTDADMSFLDGECNKATIEGQSIFVEKYLKVAKKTMKHRATKGYRNMRFLRYIHKHKAINEICDMIAPKGQITVVGFGDWSGPGNTPIRRRFCGPLQEIKKELKRRTFKTSEGIEPTVVFKSVWEYKTSMTCHYTFKQLVNMKASTHVYNGKLKKVVRKESQKIHKVLHCKTSEVGECHRWNTCNRDKNAARNILMLLMLEVRGFDRPSEFKPAELASRSRRRRTEPRTILGNVAATLSGGLP